MVIAVRVFLATVVFSLLFFGCPSATSSTGGQSTTPTSTPSTPTTPATSTTTATTFDSSSWTGSMTVTAGSNVGTTGSMSFKLGPGVNNVYPVTNLSISTLLNPTWTTQIAVMSGATLTMTATGTSTSTPGYSGTACKVTLGFSASMTGYTSGSATNWALVEYQPDGTTPNKAWTASLTLTRN